MPLTPEEKQKVRDGITRDVRSFWEQAADTATTNEERSSFLAGPPPTSPLRRIGWETGRQACRRWAAGRGPNIAPWRDLFTRDVCEQYIEDEFGPLGSGTAAPPFVGGQCAVLYRATGTLRYDRFFCFDGPTIPIEEAFAQDAIFLGPITAVRSVTSNPGQCGPTNWQGLVDSANGTGQLLFNRSEAFSRAILNPRILTVNFIRADGQPDNCGNLPDIWTPGIGPTIPPETGPIPNPPGWPIPDFDIDITVDPDGTINIDFGDGEPPEQIDPGLPAPTGGDPGPPPGDQGEPGSGGEAGEDDAEGEAPPGQVLVGVRLQLISPGPRPKVYPGGVYRGAAYIYMGGDVSLDQDFAGSLLINDQFIYAEKDNLTRWRVSANAGFRWNVTPYYRESES